MTDNWGLPRTGAANEQAGAGGRTAAARGGARSAQVRDLLYLGERAKSQDTPDRSIFDISHHNITAAREQKREKECGGKTQGRGGGQLRYVR